MKRRTMSMSKTILIVDDDPHIREVIGFALGKAGFATEQAADGKAALATAQHIDPALIVLDVGMPEMDGLEVCRSLRKTSQVPILFLSARDDEIDRVVGLEIGGDDYVTKPFSPRELVARVQAILKRGTPVAPKEKENGNVYGFLSLSIQARAAAWNGTPITLTATEFDLLAVLLRSPERVFTRDELMERAYRDLHVSDRTIDSHIRHIRSKFAKAGGEDVITTMHGVGYRLGTCRE